MSDKKEQLTRRQFIPRFGLRTALVGMGVVGGALGGWRWEQDKREARRDLRPFDRAIVNAYGVELVGKDYAHDEANFDQGACLRVFTVTEAAKHITGIEVGRDKVAVHYSDRATKTFAIAPVEGGPLVEKNVRLVETDLRIIGAGVQDMTVNIVQNGGTPRDRFRMLVVSDIPQVTIDMSTTDFPSFSVINNGRGDAQITTRDVTVTQHGYAAVKTVNGKPVTMEISR